jgi:hypothetical protein
MSREVIVSLSISFVIGCLVFWSGFWCGWLQSRGKWRDEMIKRGHARYHWVNAKWYWNEDEPKVPPRDPAAEKVRSNVRSLT